jgi:hypothetical protein
MTRPAAPARRPGPAPVDRPDRRPAPRFRRLLVIGIGAVAALLFVLTGVALAYFVTTDSSHPAQAAAATLAAPTAGAQHGTATPTSVPINWSSPTGYTPTGYTVLRCTGSSCTNFKAVTNGSCSGTISGTSCTDTDSGLAPGTTYNYEVQAQLDNWTSSPGSSFNAATSTLTSLTFTTQPTGGTSIPATGSGGFGVSVSIEDARGNVATNDSTDTVTLAIASGHNPGSGTLSCSGGLTATVSSGVASFTGCDITKVGTGYELTASSTTDASLTAPTNANSFNISAGNVSQFVLGGLAATVTAGTPVTGLTLTAEDANGNLVTDFSNTHTITWSGPANSPIGTAPALPVGSVSFTNGMSTTPLNVTFADAGSQTLTATDQSLTGSATTTVNPGPLSRYGVGLAATATAGTPLTGVTLTAEDADGNEITTYGASNQSITWSGPANSPNKTAPTLPAGSVSFSGGKSTTALSVTFTDAGAQTLTATDGSARTGSATTTVSAGTLSQYGLAVTGPATAGTATGVTLTAQDADGNTVTTYNASNQSFSWSGPANSPNNTAPTLPGTTVSFSDGVSAGLTVTLTDAGSQTLTATYGSPSHHVSATATVNGAAPATLILANCSVSGTSKTCGTSFALGNSGSLVADVQALDQYGNAATITTAVTMTVTSSDPADYGVAPPATLTISPGSNQSTSTFTVTHEDPAFNSSTITIQVNSGQSIPNLTFTVTK